MVRSVFTGKFGEPDSVVIKVKGGVVLSHESITNDPEVLTWHWTRNIDSHESGNTLSLSLILDLQNVLIGSQSVLDTAENKSDQRHIRNLFASNQPFAGDKLDSADSFVDSVSCLGWTGDQRRTGVNGGTATVLANGDAGVRGTRVDDDAVHFDLPVGLVAYRVPVQSTWYIVVLVHTTEIDDTSDWVVRVSVQPETEQILFEQAVFVTELKWW